MLLWHAGWMLLIGSSDVAAIPWMLNTRKIRSASDGDIGIWLIVVFHSLLCTRSFKLTRFRDCGRVRWAR